MALFGKNNFFGSRKTVPSHPWDSRFRVIDLTGCSDWLTLGDLFTGIGVFGAAGSGKTSSLAAIAHALMVMDCGFVWLCAKPDEVQLVTRIAESSGRSADLVVIGDDASGRLSPHRFNPLAYEASIPTTGTGSVVNYLSDCAKVLSHKDGASTPAEGERFWIDQFERLLRHCIDTAKLAGRPLSVDMLRRIQLSAPKNQAELEDDHWAKQSECWQCLSAADERSERGLAPKEDIERVIHFWTKDYMKLDNKPRSAIDVMFAVLVDAFYAEEPLRSILTTSTTVTPDDVIERGKIVVLSLPTNVYHAAGRMAQFCFKLSFQRAMLRRRKDGTQQRPAVLWVDEAHAFAHTFDAQYFAEVRSNRGISVFMDQGIGGYMRALGLRHPDEVDGFLQNLATKMFFQNNSPQTNQFAADAIGRLLTDKNTSTFSASLDGSQFGQSTSQEERHQVSSGMFGFLRRGGAENARIVQCFVLKPGLFNATRTNVALCSFQQTDLTR
jgi:hypothetical protein